MNNLVTSDWLGRDDHAFRPQARHSRASKANRFTDDARKVMGWGASTFNKYKDRVPGLTVNSITAALPEVCLVFASQTGSTGRPLPGLLQLPLNDDLRAALEKSISAKINPKGEVTEASKVASTLQQQNPIRVLHCSPDSEGNPIMMSPIYVALQAVQDSLDDVTIKGIV